MNLELLRLHTVYVGWTEEHEVVQRFWRVMEGLSSKDHAVPAIHVGSVAPAEGGQLAPSV